ncbi:MAG: PTS fructose transporter subunit IIC [Brevinema sp.]
MKFIIAVTGCPTGVAHTFMAESALKKAAEELGLDIKVETHGQAGIKNRISSEDIERAIGVIVAADKNVEAERFVGMPIVEVGVSKAIKTPHALIENILEQTKSSNHVPNIKNSLGSNKVQAITDTSIGQKIYRHLMNGISHMLPFVVGGGVLIASSFLFGIFSADPQHETYHPIAGLLMSTGGLGFQLMVPVLSAFIGQSIAGRSGFVTGFIGGMIAHDGGSGFLGGITSGFISGGIMLGIQKLLERIPTSLEGMKAIFLYPVLGFLGIGIIMYFINAPMGMINEQMKIFLSSFQNSNPIILGILVGSMCAFDMGGPVNKAAYVTGTALLAEGNFYFMAGVSAACISPPIVIALATTLFKDKFSEEQLNAGRVNYILGATHITEGAIPFAAERPWLVIPILMLGSSLSAILTFLARVQVPAPHGGFLVLPIVANGLMWVLSIFVGSLIAAILYGLSRKKIT